MFTESRTWLTTVSIGPTQILLSEASGWASTIFYPSGSLIVHLYTFILIEHSQICKAQIHFARMGEGNKGEMPHFAGQKGPEVAKGLLEIEQTFDKILRNLRLVKKKILEVKVTSWHEDFNRWLLVCEVFIWIINVLLSIFMFIKTYRKNR